MFFKIIMMENITWMFKKINARHNDGTIKIFPLKEYTNTQKEAHTKLNLLGRLS